MNFKVKFIVTRTLPFFDQDFRMDPKFRLNLRTEYQELNNVHSMKNGRSVFTVGSVPLILKLGHLLNTSFPLPSFNTHKVEEKSLFPVRKQSKGNH